MKDLRTTPGARRIRAWVAEGEHENQDFKLTVTDAHKIARSISAFANNSGGRLLIGVKDNGVIAGVRNEEDIYVVEQAATMYCSPPQEVSFNAYSVDTGVTVIVATVAAAEKRPVSVTEADGTRHPFFRVADENILAHPAMAEGWRRTWDTQSAPIVLGTEESAMLSFIAGAPPEGTDEDKIAIALHISAARVNDTLATLAALGLISFKFDGTRFRITPQKTAKEKTS